MNKIRKEPITALGYDFISAEYIPQGKDEYYFRNKQNDNRQYRNLTEDEKHQLIINNNTSDNWNNVLVSEAFNPQLIKRTTFYGLVRIGVMKPEYLEFHNFKMPVGIYDSTIISSDIGDNNCLSNVQYLSHYVLGTDVMIANVNEITATDHAKFGNGVIKEGEDEKTRVWVEVCNENAERRIIPFNSMLPGDAWLWSRFRDDKVLQERFKEITERDYNTPRGYYGQVGDRTVIKNCKILKDVNIGSDAYLKGANKIKNVTINSDENRTSQIGEGVELVNGIVGYGCRLFYGVKAVRFVMAAHSQLKYGARLINSYLGSNSTISCCEVLNSLIFPAHEQHHNNSFLCASLVMGQSNIAAGATIGSNHNSRSPDGEIIANRGFWPGLCVSLKHNSKFASFTILAKADYPAELNITIPFSLVSNDVAHDKLLILPGYWFKYNMYALERNSWKYVDRDKRTVRKQFIDYDYLAPDTVNEMFESLTVLKQLQQDSEGCYYAKGVENSNRKVQVLKVPESIALFTEMITYYGATQILQYITENKITDFAVLKKALRADITRDKWINIGSQLMPAQDLDYLKSSIKNRSIESWHHVHDFYKTKSDSYKADKLHHAYNSLLEILGITGQQFTPEVLADVLKKALATREWMTKGIYESRAKDYTNPFRKMVYETTEEMNAVLGRIEDNSFIQKQVAQMETFRETVNNTLKAFT